jgi:hypothetical protein
MSLADLKCNDAMVSFSQEQCSRAVAGILVFCLECL